MEVSDKSIGIIGKKDEDVLEAGELVVLDTDFLFNYGDIDIEEDRQDNPPPTYIFFEDRYLEELEQEREER